MNHKTLAVAGTLVATALTGGGLAVAQSAKPKREPAPAVFQERLAAKLGVSETQLRAATKSASKETVTELRRDGRLDAKRAAGISKRIERTGAAPFALLGKAGGGGGLRRVAVKALAAELKVERSVLAKELKAGKAPATIISERGGDRERAQAAVRKAVRDRLEVRVKRGKMKAEKADQRAEKVAGRLTGSEPLKRKAP